MVIYGNCDWFLREFDLIIKLAVVYSARQIGSFDEWHMENLHVDLTEVIESF